MTPTGTLKAGDCSRETPDITLCGWNKERNISGLHDFMSSQRSVGIALFGPQYDNTSALP